MDIFNQLSSHFQGWNAYLTTDAGRLAAWPYVWTGLKILLALVILLLVLYQYRARQVRRQRGIKYRLSKLISHLCDTYEQMEDIDWKNQIYYTYVIHDGKLNVQEKPFQNVTELAGELHPEDARKYTEDFLRSAVEKAMKTCGQVEFTAREKQKDGSYRWMSYLLQGIKKDKTHRRSCLLLKHGVDDMHSQEMERRAQLTSAMDQARELAEAKSKFMAHISKDTREALHSIMGYLTLAEDEASQETRKEYVRESQEQVRYLLGVLNDVIDLSAMENGTLQTHYEAFDVQKLLDSLNQVFQDEAAKRQLDFSMQVEALQYPRLLGDQNRLEQVLLNVLNNAMLFTEAQHKVTCQIREKAIKHKRVCLEAVVQCEGMEVPENMLDKVFLPFELSSQVDGNTVHGGLGLAVTHNLVHVLGGVIKADQAEGKGMRFTIELPFGYEKHAAKLTAEEVHLQGKHLLVAEDSDLNAQVLEKITAPLGMLLDRVTNGKEACDKFAQAAPHTYDAILLDLDMPVMNGNEAAKVIRAMDREDAKTVPIIAMTENLISEDVAQALKNGMNGQLVKPLEKEQLLQVLLSFL